MARVTRFILIVSLLMQSVPGLTVVRCASMAGGECQGGAYRNVSAHKACSCGCAHTDAASGGDEAMGCCCGQPEPEKPAPLPSDSKNQQLHQFLAVALAFSGMLPPEPMAAPAIWDRSVQTPHQPSNSIQSLLCVWLM